MSNDSCNDFVSSIKTKAGLVNAIPKIRALTPEKALEIVLLLLVNILPEEDLPESKVPPIPVPTPTIAPPPSSSPEDIELRRSIVITGIRPIVGTRLDQNSHVHKLLCTLFDFLEVNVGSFNWYFMGRVQDASKDSSPLLKVVLPCSKLRRQLMANLKKLKSPPSDLKKIFVRPSMDIDSRNKYYTLLTQRRILFNESKRKSRIMYFPSPRLMDCDTNEEIPMDEEIYKKTVESKGRRTSQTQSTPPSLSNSAPVTLVPTSSNINSKPRHTRSVKPSSSPVVTAPSAEKEN